MITKYKVGGYRAYGESLIKEVEVERETECNVWIKGSRHAKRTNYISFYDSWDEAYNTILSKAERTVIQYKDCLERAEANLAEIKALKP